ncbi:MULTISPECIES: hypothetical protein [Alcaligenes]|uniref:Uncharacterized protein n=1 Tax=Alcaligenes parafaecalis TaxID=171260 RepID=A0ABT3VI74_9BURK|nr:MULTISPECIES: hypothetical protein [Alcaligenes]MCX5463194.1 hypothetical protein [Alcaligenes parafaecalis]QTC00632.1 hypothetical protein JYG33_03955 [Alcaligenes sp. SORT26]
MFVSARNREQGRGTATDSNPETVGRAIDGACQSILPVCLGQHGDNADGCYG